MAIRQIGRIVRWRPRAVSVYVALIDAFSYLLLVGRGLWCQCRFVPWRVALWAPNDEKKKNMPCFRLAFLQIKKDTKQLMKAPGNPWPNAT